MTGAVHRFRFQPRTTSTRLSAAASGLLQPWLPLALLICVTTSCDKRAQPDGSRDGSAILATVGDERITVAEFQAEWNRRGFAGRPASLEARNRLLEEMIQTKAALVRARESGFDRRADTKVLVENLIASRYREEAFAKRAVAGESITDAEVAAYYSNNLSRFTISEAVQAGVITLNVGSKADDVARETIRALAESLRERAARSTDAEFNQLVREHSEDQSTRYIGGDTGWLEKGKGDSRLPDGIVDAAFELPSPGAVAPVVETREGFFVVRLSDRREAARRPLTEVAPAIRYELEQRARRQQEQKFQRELTNGLPIKVDASALEQFQSPAAVPSPTPPVVPGGD